MLFSNLLTLFLSLSYIKFCNSEKDNSILEKVNPFRSGKINLLWDKAKKTLNKNELPKLFEDFSMQDRLQMDLKKVREYDIDHENKEAYSRQKLINILEKYNLGHIYPYDEIGEKRLSSLQNIKSRISKDARLSKLWNKIENGKFNELELKELEKEFLQYLDKLDEFQLLKNELENLKEHSSNMIQKHKNDPVELLDSVKNKNSILKKKHYSVKEKYQELQNLIESKKNLSYNQIIDETESFDQEYDDVKDPRIVELWNLADQSNLTDIEKQAFKEELGHFGRKIAKHDYYLREATRQKSKQNNQQFNNVFEDLEDRIKKQAKKEKSTDCDSALIQLLCVHG